MAECFDLFAIDPKLESVVEAEAQGILAAMLHIHIAASAAMLILHDLLNGIGRWQL